MSDNDPSAPMPEQFLSFVSDKLKAISHPLRLRIAETLEKQKEVRVGDIAGACGENQPLVSQHLTQMRRAGVVATRRKGTQIFYRLSNDNFKKILGCLRDEYNSSQQPNQPDTDDSDPDFPHASVSAWPSSETTASPSPSSPDPDRLPPA